MPFRRLKNVRYANIEGILHSALKTSRLVLHKTFRKNVCHVSKTLLKKVVQKQLQN